MCYYGGYRPVTKADAERARAYNISERTRARIARNGIESVGYLPLDYTQWRKTLFNKTMFYHKLKRGHYLAHCEACDEVVPLKNARSSRKIKCPHCGSDVVLRNVDKMDYFELKNYAAVLEKVPDGWVQRLFIVYKVVQTNNICAPISVKYDEREEERDFIDSIGARWFFHPTYENNRIKSWRRGPGRAHGMGWSSWRICDQPLECYPNNLKEIFKGSPFEYSAIDLMTAKTLINPFLYLSKYLGLPELEMLAKFGLFSLARQLMNEGNYIAAKLKKNKGLKALGIDSKDELPECANLDYEELIARKEIKKWRLEGQNVNTAIRFITILNNRSGEDFEYSFISRRRLFEYYLQQQSLYSKGEPFDYSAGSPIRAFLNDYTDYIAECHQLGYNVGDTAICMPRDLKLAHRGTTDAIKIKENEVFDGQIYAWYQKLHNLLEFSNGTLQTIMPKCAAEIIEEGRRQNHCVGRYCERAAKGESIILFVRRVEDIQANYFTMEIKPDLRKLDVVQCRDNHNADYMLTDQRAAVQRFLTKYARWFKKRPLDGYEQELMVRYYKAVHKHDGKYISNYDKKMEFKVGEWAEAQTDNDPDKVAVKGLHIASLEFAQNFGDGWRDVAILEVEADIHDIVVPDAKDQVRTSRFKVVREVPFSEMGEWGQRHLAMLSA